MIIKLGNYKTRNGHRAMKEVCGILYDDKWELAAWTWGWKGNQLTHPHDLIAFWKD